MRQEAKAHFPGRGMLPQHFVDADQSLPPGKPALWHLRRGTLAAYPLTNGAAHLAALYRGWWFAAMTEAEEIETINDCLVALQGDDITIMLLGARLPREKAIRMAAWIVAMTDPDEFQKVLTAIGRT